MPLTRPMPAGSIAARRRVRASGRIGSRQPVRLGPSHVGEIVTVIIEDTCYQILRGEEELAIKPRRDTTPVTRTSAAREPSQADVSAGRWLAEWSR